MNIIFGKEQADTLCNKYTVLELDTFRVGESGPIITAYCTVENLPFDELPGAEQRKTQHEHLLINYRLKNWNDCLAGIDELMGKWNGELDTFYSDLQQRIHKYQAQDPGSNWTPTIQK
jgi:hypothetical protein